MIYHTLEQTDLQLIHRAFIEAFSDYAVPMAPPFEGFERMMRRRGFAPSASIGAFDGDKLIGFSLTGLRESGGIFTAYDIATGVVPKYRRHGVTSAIFIRERALLRQAHANRYLLEVIQTNLPAFQLYRKQGFQIRRDFSCFRVDRSRLTPRAAYRAEQIHRIDPEQAKRCWDFAPSWQNSYASVSAVSEAFHCVVIRLSGKAAGYGIIEKDTGDIPQFGVDPKFRRAGVGTSLLAELAKNTTAQTIQVLNTETPQKAVGLFLNSLDFECCVKQYEMVLTL